MIFTSLPWLQNQPEVLTLCMLGNFACFLSSVDFFFSKSFFFSKKYFRNAISMSNSLDPDQARRCKRCQQTTAVDLELQSESNSTRALKR